MGLNKTEKSSNTSRVSIRMPDDLKECIKAFIEKLNQLRNDRGLNPITFSSFVKHCVTTRLMDIKNQKEDTEGWGFLREFDLKEFLL